MLHAHTPFLVFLVPLVVMELCLLQIERVKLLKAEKPFTKKVTKQ